MLLAFFAYSSSDACAKYLTQDFHPLQVTWIRLLGLTLGVLVLLRRYGPGLFRSRRPGLQVLRGFTAVGSSLGFVAALVFVPLADATAVAFVAPFLVTVMAALFLGEKVGLQRWLAVLAGFAGTIIIVRPGTGVLHPGIGFALLTALSLALRQILSRLLGNEDPTRTTVAYTGLTAIAAMTLPLPFLWTWPDNGTQILVMGLMALLAGAGELLFILALERTAAVILAPLQYTAMIWSTLWGALIFAQLPDRWTLAGAAVIMASGGYALYRETRAKTGIPKTPAA